MSIEHNMKQLRSDANGAEQEAYETEHHFHNLAIITPAVPSNGVGPLESHENADTWGDWLLLIAKDTFEQGGSYTKGEPSLLILKGMTASRILIIEIGYGDGTVGATTVYGRLIVDTYGNQETTIPVQVMCKRMTYDGASNVYIRLMGSGGEEAIVDVWVSTHHYER